MHLVCQRVKRILHRLHTHKTVGDFHRRAFGQCKLVTTVDVGRRARRRIADDDGHSRQGHAPFVFHGAAQFYRLGLRLRHSRTHRDVNHISLESRLAGRVAEKVFQQIPHILVLHVNIHRTDALNIPFVVDETQPRLFPYLLEERVHRTLPQVQRYGLLLRITCRMGSPYERQHENEK